MAEPDQSLNGNETEQQEENLQPEQAQAQEHENDSVTAGGERWPGWPGESVFRILVPAQKVGSIIGRKGEYIKKMCEETKARIKILDGPPGTTERAVMISGKEDPESSLPPAIDGLLRVHKRVVDGLNSDSSQAPPFGSKISTRLLVPAAQAGNLIGKQGTTVKSIQEASNCIVRVLGTEDLPIFAFQDDRIVEVTGEPTATHKAIELIASHLRKFLVDRSIISIFEMQMQKPVPHMEYVPPNQSWGPPPQPFPPSVAGHPGYRIDPFLGPTPRQPESYYPPVEMPPHLEKPSYQGLSAYNREPPVAVQSSSGNQAVQSLITQVTQQMVIPLSYADAVIGTDGASISYIRRVSGATVTIQENREVPGEMTAEISGSASQVQTAQQLIQNCIAEAAAAQTQAAAATTEQGYHGYAGQSSVYAPTSSNSGVGGQGGGYGSVYGGNYGY